jgi:hypothetical protein
MAFSPRSLILESSLPVGLVSGLPAANRSCNFYRYATDDAAATVIAAGYFNGARHLKVNDIIACVSVAGGAGDFLNLIVTASPAAPGNITVAVNGEAVGT